MLAFCVAVLFGVKWTTNGVHRTHGLNVGIHLGIVPILHVAEASFLPNIYVGWAMDECVYDLSGVCRVK